MIEKLSCKSQQQQQQQKFVMEQREYEQIKHILTIIKDMESLFDLQKSKQKPV